MDFNFDVIEKGERIILAIINNAFAARINNCWVLEKKPGAFFEILLAPVIKKMVSINKSNVLIKPSIAKNDRAIFAPVWMSLAFLKAVTTTSTPKTKPSNETNRKGNHICQKLENLLRLFATLFFIHIF